MAIHFLLILLVAGIIYHSYRYFKNRFHAKIRLSALVSTVVLLAFVLILFLKVDVNQTMKLLVGLAAVIYFILGFLSEGFNDRGIAYFSSTISISFFIEWTDINKIEIDPIEKKSLIRVKFYGKEGTVIFIQHYPANFKGMIEQLSKKNDQPPISA